MLVYRPKLNSLSCPSIIRHEDIIELGWKKAVILGHLPQCFNGDGSHPDEEELYKFFRIFPKKTFYKLLKELIADGHLKYLKDGGKDE